MSIALLLGGTSEHGNVQHRYLAGRFLEQFGEKVDCIISARPKSDPISVRLRRMIKRGHYRERLARAIYGAGYGPSDEHLQPLLLPGESSARMPGGDRHFIVDSHNGSDCEVLLDQYKPDVIVVYGTAIIKSNIFSRAQRITLNMHTGLSPYYRGDSTLFWPVYYDDPSKLGVTVHELVESVDGGAIAATAQVVYEPGDSEANLFAKGVMAGTDIYLRAVQQALDGTLICTPQDLSAGREFRWMHRTVAAERQVLSNLQTWART
ncbi:MAG: formyl transferase [Granulosicoccus sp.]|nr:formyl transferase [Granulosicoccus sp.]